MIKDERSDSKVTPLGAYRAYGRSVGISDPQGRIAAFKDALVSPTLRARHVEAEVSADDIRDTPRKKDKDFLTNVTVMARIEQILTQGKDYPGVYDGGHLIADRLMAKEPKSAEYWNLAPQWGSFNSVEYTKLENFIANLAKPPDPGTQQPGAASQGKGKASAKGKGKGKATVTTKGTAGGSAGTTAAAGQTLLVTAKVTYGADLALTPEWLRTLGFGVDESVTRNLALPRRIPESWSLRARVKPAAHSPRASGPAPKPAPTTWRDELRQAAPTVETGVAIKTGYTDSALGIPQIEHRAAGPRPQRRGLGSYPSAPYRDAEAWKLRAIQWTPPAGRPSEADIGAAIGRWFPTAAEALHKREAAAELALAVSLDLEQAGHNAWRRVIVPLAKLSAKGAGDENTAALCDALTQELEERRSAIRALLSGGGTTPEALKAALAAYTSFIEGVQAPVEKLVADADPAVQLLGDVEGRSDEEEEEGEEIGEDAGSQELSLTGSAGSQLDFFQSHTPPSPAAASNLDEEEEEQSEDFGPTGIPSGGESAPTMTPQLIVLSDSSGSEADSDDEVDRPRRAPKRPFVTTQAVAPPAGGSGSRAPADPERERKRQRRSDDQQPTTGSGK